MPFQIYPPASTSGMTNPMTTAGDVIVGGSSGTPGRLAVGGAYDTLNIDSVTGLPTWVNPYSALGDILIGGSSPSPHVNPSPLNVGADGDVLQVVGGVPAWAAPAVPPSSLLPTVAKDADFTADKTEARFYIVETSSQANTVTLPPTASNQDAEFTVIVTGDGSYPVTITVDNTHSEAINSLTDGAVTSTVFPNAADQLHVVCNNTIWIALISIKASALYW